MTRNGGLRGMAALVLALGVGLSSPAAGATQVTALVLPVRAAGGSVASAAALMFADEASKRLPGGFDFDLRPSTIYGSDKQTLNALVNGLFDVVFTSSGTLAGLVPGLGIFDVPFLIRDQTHAKHVFEGPVGQEYIAKLRDKGIIVLGWGEEGFRDITTSNKPVTRPADLAGLKMRVIPNFAYELTFKTLGAVATPMAIGELYDALRSGRMDGEDNPTSQIFANSLQDVQAYLSLSDHFYASTLVVINRASFERLDADQQAALRAAGQAAADFTRKRSAENHAKELETLRGKGMKIVDKFDRDAFVKALAPAYDEFGKRYGADMLARIHDTQ